MRRYKVLVVYVLIIAILLFSGALYYYNEQQNAGLTPPDSSCELLDVHVRDECCAELHRDDDTGLCVGTWHYVAEDQRCEFRCEEDFDPPTLCERSGGEWREFLNGCVDSCELERTPEIITCVQALTFGCDCGTDMCWNGRSCEIN